MLPPRRFSSAWAAPRFSGPLLLMSRCGFKSGAASRLPWQLPETTSPAPSGRQSSPGHQAYGWRNAYIALGVLTVSLMLPLSLFLRRRASLDERPSPSIAARGGGQAPDGTPVLQGLLILAGLACCVAMSMPQVHIIAYCGDLGYGPARGAEMLSLMLGFAGWPTRVGSSPTHRWSREPLIGSFRQCLALVLHSLAASPRSTWSPPLGLPRAHRCQAMPDRTRPFPAREAEPASPVSTATF